MTDMLSGWDGFAPEEVEFLAGLERFASRELAASETWDVTAVRRCAELGLQSLLIDEDGAFDASRLLLAVASSEVLGSWDPAVGLAVGVARIHSLVLSKYASDELRKRWLDPVLAATAIGSMAISEAAAGTDVRAVETVARAESSGWVLSGEKLWVTMGPVADFTIVLAKIGSADRSSDMGVFVVERGWEGVSYGLAEQLDTFDGVPVGSLVLQDVAVPATHVLAAAGGFSTIMAAVNYARLEAACTGVAVQRGALRLAAQHAGVRESFGVPIHQHQAVQLALGRMALDLEASRALLYRTAAAGFDEIRPAQLSCAKAFATDAAMATATRLIDILGAVGLVAGGLPMAFFRGAKSAQIYDGTSDINVMSVGRAVCRTARP